MSLDNGPLCQARLLDSEGSVFDCHCHSSVCNDKAFWIIIPSCGDEPEYCCEDHIGLLVHYKNHLDEYECSNTVKEI